MTYRALGRNQDALMLQEKALESWRRVLPENHPEMGVIDLRAGFVCNFTLSVPGNAMHNLGAYYMELGRHQDAVVVQEKLLELWRRVLPDDHPNIGLNWLS